MENKAKIVHIWKPIKFNDNWLSADTSKLDNILPSWFRKREELQSGNKDFEDFLARLKRQHAIETGVVEKLYDLNEGITQTFIKEGFVESYLQHGDTNISPKKLMGFLKDHFDAIDFVFDLVKSNRPLTKSFILELHQLLTQNQDTTDAIDGQGNVVQIPLVKGRFKENPNNPQREDGTIYEYCPPIHVDSEVEKLLELYHKLISKDINPLIISSWFHHAFTIIHPFQDGNGRVARLLASLILIKNGLFPLTISRTEKVKYINALENADDGNPSSLVELFSDLQKKNIEGILNWKSETKLNFNSLKDAAQVLSQKVDYWQAKQQQERQILLTNSRKEIFDIVYNLVGEIKNELNEIIPSEKARIFIQSVYPDSRIHYYYTKQIIEYAFVHNYFFNKNLSRGWFKLSFQLNDEIQYDLVITLHHYSYDDAILAIGGFLEFKENRSKSGEIDTEESSLIPIKISPYTISLEAEPAALKKNIESYIKDIITIGVSHIANEIN